MKKVKRKRFWYLKAFIMFTILLAVTGCTKTNTNIEDYLQNGTIIDEHAKDMMPVLEQLPEYEDIEYIYTHKTMPLFQSDSVALIVTYDEKTYENEKENLAENYTFLEEKVTYDTSDENVIIPENEFTVNSYTFKVVNGNENNDFPKSFGMIGTSDQNRSIAYLYFYDFDLDYIGEEDESAPMENFVREYFNYDFL